MFSKIPNDLYEHGLSATTLATYLVLTHEADKSGLVRGLSTTEIGNQIGLTREAIRPALKALQTVGFIRVIPKNGTESDYEVSIPQSKYHPIDSSILSLGLTKTVVAVYMYYARCANNEERLAYPSRNTVREKTGVHPSTITEVLKELDSKGLVSRIDRIKYLVPRNLQTETILPAKLDDFKYSNLQTETILNTIEPANLGDTKKRPTDLDPKKQIKTSKNKYNNKKTNVVSMDREIIELREQLAYQLGVNVNDMKLSTLKKWTSIYGVEYLKDRVAQLSATILSGREIDAPLGYLAWLLRNHDVSLSLSNNRSTFDRATSHKEKPDIQNIASIILINDTEKLKALEDLADELNQRNLVEFDAIKSFLKSERGYEEKELQQLPWFIERFILPMQTNNWSHSELIML